MSKKFYKKKKFYALLSASIFLFFLLFFLVLVIRTSLVEIPDGIICLGNHTTSFNLDNKTLARFRKSLSFKTVSLTNENEFSNLIDFIERSFPLIHSSKFIKRELVENYTLLYKINGTNTNLKPYMMIGHLDVVPVNPSEWSSDPFAAQIRDEYIYARGTLDAKYIVMASLEALERMLEKQVSFDRSFYLLFGHDEESFGLEGAKSVSSKFEEQKIELEFILDEGTFFMPDLIPGINDGILPAFVSITEKGYLTVNISTSGDSGHASMPPEMPSTVILATALSKLKGDSQPNLFGSGPEVEMFTHLAPYVSFFNKMIFSNLWLFSGILGRMLSQKARSNAIVRTTTAVTMLNAGYKENVIPSEAWSLVNLRVHPAHTNAKVIAIMKDIMDDDRIKVDVKKSVEPAPVSPITQNSFGFQMIKRSITQTHSNSVVIPSTLIASTDSKWFHKVSKATYRFSPATVYAVELNGIHGKDERISLQSYRNAINFYFNLIRESNNSEIVC